MLLVILVVVAAVVVFAVNPPNATQAHFEQSQEILSGFFRDISLLGNEPQSLGKVCRLAETCRRQTDRTPASDSKYRSVRASQIEFLDDICDFCRQRTSENVIHDVSDRLFRSMQDEYPATCYLTRSDFDNCYEKVKKIHKVAFAKKSGVVVQQRPVIVVTQPVRPQSVPTGAGIKPESMTRYLTDGDLAGYDAFDLNIIRNEIYARHGRSFVKAIYRDYFRRQGWYSENSSYQGSWLSPIEKRNANFVAAYQSRYGLQ